MRGAAVDQRLQRAIRDRAHQLAQRRAERPQRRDRPLALGEVTRPHQQQAERRRAVVLGRQERQRRRAVGHRASSRARRARPARTRAGTAAPAAPARAASRSVRRARAARPGCRSYSNAVAMPKLPPPPRRPQNSSGSRLGVDAPSLAVGGDELDGAQVVDGEPVAAHQVPEAAAERQPADADVADGPAGGGEPVALRREVELGPQHAAGRPRDARRRVDGRRPSSATGRSSPRRRATAWPATECPPPRTVDGQVALAGEAQRALRRRRRPRSARSARAGGRSRRSRCAGPARSPLRRGAAARRGSASRRDSDVVIREVIGQSVASSMTNRSRTVPRPRNARCSRWISAVQGWAALLVRRARSVAATPAAASPREPRTPRPGCAARRPSSPGAAGSPCSAASAARRTRRGPPRRARRARRRSRRAPPPRVRPARPRRAVTTRRVRRAGAPGRRAVERDQRRTTGARSRACGSCSRASASAASRVRSASSRVARAARACARAGCGT